MNNKFSKNLLIVITILCAFLIIISYMQSSLLDPIRHYAGYILTPVQNGISTFGNAVAGDIEENRHLHNVYRENKQLSERIDKLTEENSRLKSESQELARLRELYKLDRTYMQYPKVAARVIAKDSQKWFRVFRLDKGLADGIQKDMNVICSGGLVGIVTEVGGNYCTVRSIIDDESNIYAESQYSGDTCLVKGNITSYEEGTLDISNISKDAVFNDGDAVVTSELSTKYLPGILIGYASDINIDSQHLTKSGKLIPVADFEKIKEVLIITTIKTDSGLVDTGAGEADNVSDEGILTETSDSPESINDSIADIDISSDTSEESSAAESSPVSETGSAGEEEASSAGLTAQDSENTQ